MEDIDRRSALALGLATAATLPALFTPTPAFAQRYRPDEGREIAPGVRRVDLTKRASEIPGYATVSMRDMVYQPGAKSENPAMANDMVCHCLEGELQVSQGPDNKFVAKTGDVWSCKKGMPEANVNNGSTVAIMRVIDLIPPA
jgi:quercetin dioxygenase-like cupin family protein